MLSNPLPERSVRLLFADLQKQINKFLKGYGIELSEPAVSMILGALVVIIVAVLAYNYFRQGSMLPTGTPPVEESAEGELTGPGASVALPATHTVKEGEYLWQIAEKYYKSGYNFVDIVAVNNLANPDYLQVGQKLTIPKVEVRQPLTVEAALAPAVTNSKITGDRYKVQKGDSLWSIAVRAYADGYKWVDVARANNLSNPDLIFSDTELKLPR